MVVTIFERKVDLRLSAFSRRIKYWRAWGKDDCMTSHLTGSCLEWEGVLLEPRLP